MKCSSCGAEFSGGAFCPHCGTKADIAPTSAQAPKNNAQAQANYTQAQTNHTQARPSYAQPQANYTQPQNTFAGTSSSMPYPPTPAKKKSKAPVIIGIVVAIVAVIAILGLVFADSITRATVGETSYYLLREADTVSELLDLDFDKLGKNDKFAVDGNAKLSVEGSNEDAQKLSSYYSQLNLNLKANVNQNDSKAMLNISANTNGNKASLNLNTSKDGLSISAPELADTSYYLDFAENALFSDTDFSKIASRLSGIIKEVEEEELDGCITSEREEVNGKSCRVVTYTFTEKTAMNAFAALLEKVMDDDKLMEELEPVLSSLITTYAQRYSSGTNAPTYSDFINQMKENIKMLKEEANNADSTEKAYFKIAYSGKHIVQRTLDLSEVADTKVVIDSDVSGSDKSLSFASYYGEEKEMEGSLSLSSSGSKKDLSLDVSEEGETIIKASLSDYEVEKENGVYAPTGTLSLELPDNDIRFTLSTSGDDLYSLKLKVENMTTNDMAFVVTIDNELSSSPDFSDYEEPSGGGTSDLNEFMNALSDGIEDYYSSSVNF